MLGADKPYYLHRLSQKTTKYRDKLCYNIYDNLIWDDGRGAKPRT